MARIYHGINLVIFWGIKPSFSVPGTEVPEYNHVCHCGGIAAVYWVCRVSIIFYFCELKLIVSILLENLANNTRSICLPGLDWNENSYG